MDLPEIDSSSVNNNDNHKHYTKLAEDKFESFIGESNKSINKQDYPNQVNIPIEEL